YDPRVARGRGRTAHHHCRQEPTWRPLDAGHVSLLEPVAPVRHALDVPAVLASERGHRLPALSPRSNHLTPTFLGPSLLAHAASFARRWARRQGAAERTDTLAVTKRALGPVLAGAELAMGIDSVLNGSARIDTLVMSERARITGT